MVRASELFEGFERRFPQPAVHPRSFLHGTRAEHVHAQLRHETFKFSIIEFVEAEITHAESDHWT